MSGETLRNEIAGDLAGMIVDELEFELLQVEVCGDHAWARGRSRATIEAGAQRPALTGSFLWILRREDGEWRIATA